MAGLAPGSDSCAPKIPSTVMAGLVPAPILSVVMPALVAGIHVLRHRVKKDVDGRNKPGHDD